MDIDAYLERIGYSGSREPTLATLRALQRAHRLAVPFENLDIHVGRKLAFDESELFDKIVRGRRGGWCHELNGLWSRALRQLGFRLDVIAASVVSPAVQVSMPFGHCTVIVHLEEDWWSDVGFGSSLFEPVSVSRRGPQFVCEAEYEFSAAGPEWSMRSDVPGVAPLGLRFALQAREYEEFRETAEWQQTAPESLFTQRPVASLLTESGRVSLVADTLTIVHGEDREEFRARSEAELDELLQAHFGIELGEHAWRGFPWRKAEGA